MFLRRAGRALSATVFLSIAFACAERAEDTARSDWLHVLDIKRATVNAAEGDVAAQQRYVDSLAQFLQRHPEHARGRTVYRDVLLEHGSRLADDGLYDSAAQSYATALRLSPNDPETLRRLAFVNDRRVVTLEEIAEIPLGATKADVTGILGPPAPGWTNEILKDRRRFESWYYRRDDDGVAGVFFVDGKVFAAEYSARVQLQKPGR